MRAFAAAWPGRETVHRVVAQLSWRQNIALLEDPYDKPTIGLLLCRERNRLVVEYALRGLNKPIGVAEWETRIVEKLPDDLKGSLPTVEEIEAELGGIHVDEEGTVSPSSTD